MMLRRLAIFLKTESASVTALRHDPVDDGDNDGNGNGRRRRHGQAGDPVDQRRADGDLLSVHAG
ncbi:Na+/H+ antiporter NhaA type [Azospirillum largimobile]